MDTKLMVDLATGVMAECNMLDFFSESETSELCEKLEAIFKEAAAGAPDLRSAKLQEVIAFLMGEGPLDGFYFGDSDTARPRAAFWWRKHLRAALASAAPVEALTDEEIEGLACEYSLDGSMLHGSRFLNYLRPFARAIEARIMGGVK